MMLIDIGCFNGDSPLHFIADPQIDSIVAFDPNPRHRGIWAAIEAHYPSIKFNQLAISDHNGTAEYSLMPEEKPLGSTISKEKRDFGSAEVTEVRVKDIAEIVTEPCWMKLDAEGEEYKILERLIETDKLRLVKKIWLEWHTGKMVNDYKAREEAIKAEIEKLGIEVKPW